MSSFPPVALLHRWFQKFYKQPNSLNIGVSADVQHVAVPSDVVFRQSCVFSRWKHLLILMNFCFFISIIIFNIGLHLTFRKELSWIAEEIIYFGILCFANIFILFWWRVK